MSTMTSALGCTGHFIFKEQTEPYRGTVKEYSQKKNALSAKSRRRIFGSAKKSTVEVRTS